MSLKNNDSFHNEICTIVKYFLKLLLIIINVPIKKKAKMGLFALISQKYLHFLEKLSNEKIFHSVKIEFCIKQFY